MRGEIRTFAHYLACNIGAVYVHDRVQQYDFLIADHLIPVFTSHSSHLQTASVCTKTKPPNREIVDLTF